MVPLLLTYQGPHPLENSLLLVGTFFPPKNTYKNLLKIHLASILRWTHTVAAMNLRHQLKWDFTSCPQIFTEDLKIINFSLKWSAPPPGYGGEGESGGYPGERYGRRRDSREDRCVSFLSSAYWFGNPLGADTARETMTEERETGVGEDVVGADRGKGLSSPV